MMHILRAEWNRLMRHGMLLGAVAMAALGVLATVIIFGQATTSAPSPGDPQIVSASVLEERDGLVQAFGFASQVIGGASLVLFARSVTNDFQYGTLKVLLTREPRRLAFLAGKVVVMAVFVCLVLVATVVGMMIAALIVAGVRGLDLSAWGTPNGVLDTFAGTLRLLVVALVWGLFGVALGATFRSAGPAIGVGIGVFAIGGHIIERFFTNAAEWFPTLVLAVFTVGGTDNVPVVQAGIVAAAYGIGLAVASAVAFARGDVPA